MAACYLFFHCRFVSWVLFDRKLLWRKSETILLLEKTRKTSTPENTALVSDGLRIFYTDVYQSVTRQVNIFFVYIQDQDDTFCTAGDWCHSVHRHIHRPGNPRESCLPGRACCLHSSVLPVFSQPFEGNFDLATFQMIFSPQNLQVFK